MNAFPAASRLATTSYDRRLRTRALAHDVVATWLHQACIGFTVASWPVVQEGQGKGTGDLLVDGKDGEYPGAGGEVTEQQQEQRRKAEKWAMACLARTSLYPVRGCPGCTMHTTEAACAACAGRRQQAVQLQANMPCLPAQVHHMLPTQVRHEALGVHWSPWPL